MMIPFGHFKSKNVIVDRNIEVTFTGTPTYFNITKSIVRFDKKFAFGWSADDTLIDSSNIALPAFKGGNVIHKDGVVANYPGMYYTDGCDNDIPFNYELKLVAFSIVSGATTSTTFLSYKQINKAYVQGVGYVNHSYGHAAQDSDFSLDPLIKEQQVTSQITDGYDLVRSHTGIRMMYFSPPSNYYSYFPIAYQMYLVKNKVGFLAEFRPDLSTTVRQYYGNEKNTMEFYSTLTDIGSGGVRDFTSWTDGSLTNTSGDTAYIDEVISSGTSTKHYWFSCGSHQLGSAYGAADYYAPTSGGFKWLTFKSFFERLQSTYGKTGADNMWMENDTNIWEYIQCYKFANISVLDKSPTVKKISIDFSNCNPEFRYHTTSFVISTDVNITGVTISGFDTSSYKINYKSLGNGNVLVNVQYSPQYETALYKRLKALSGVETLEFTTIQSDKIIAQANVDALNNGSYKTSLQNRINAVQILSNSTIVRIDLGFNGSALSIYPWNNMSVSGSTVPFGVGSGIANLISMASQTTGWSIYVTEGGFNGAVSSSPSDDGTLLYPLNAHRDGLIINAGAGNHAVLTISNLDSLKLYDIKLYASRFISAVQKYTVNGVVKTYEIQNNRNVTCNFTNISSVTSITIRVEGNTSSIVAMLGVIEIIEHL